MHGLSRGLPLLLLALLALLPSGAQSDPVPPCCTPVTVYVSGAAYPQNAQVIATCGAGTPQLFIAQADTSASPCTTSAWKASGGIRVFTPSTNYVAGELILFQGDIWVPLMDLPNAASPAPPLWSSFTAGPPLVPLIQPGGAPTTAADLNAIIAATPAGGVVRLGCGTYDLGGTTLVVTHSMTIQGCYRKNAGTILSGSGSPLLDISGANGIVLRDFGLAGVSTNDLVHLTNCQDCRITNMRFDDSATALKMDIVTSSVLDALAFNHYTTSAITISNTAGVDGGDNTITSSTFFSNSTGTPPFPTNTIAWTSSGGFRLTNNKFLGFLNPGGSVIDFNLSSGSTGDLSIIGNSIEWGPSPATSGYGIRVRNGGTSMQFVTINSNQFTTAFYKIPISIEGVWPANPINNLNITGNIIQVSPSGGAGSTGINVTGSDRVAISGNQINGDGANTTGIALSATVFNACVSGNAFGSVPTPVSASGNGLIAGCGSFFGNIPTTGAGSKKVVCVDTTTGQFYASTTGTDCSN